MLPWFSILLFIANSILAALVSYLLLLTWAAAHGSQITKPGSHRAHHRFLILIPAHNEENLLPDLLSNLAELDYPKTAFSVHVVADNCTDRTAEVAQEGGASVHERFNSQQIGKGYALQWLLERLWQANAPHDAVVIFDADTLVSANFLKVMDAHLAIGEKVIQAYYAVRDPERSWISSLRFVALAVLHYLRPAGRMFLGASVGLKGNGMVFAEPILRTHPWSASVTEDIELHMQLLLNGERVTFAPEAILWGEMPDSLTASESQHERWESGRLQMARRYIPLLLQAAGAAVRRKDYPKAYRMVDAIIEHVIPPFSLFVGASGLLFMLSLIVFLGSWSSPGHSVTALAAINLFLASLILTGESIYLLTGLRLVHASRHIYKTLAYVPLLMVWKIGQYIRVLMRRSPLTWNRTARNEG